MELVIASVSATPEVRFGGLMGLGSKKGAYF
jgi:hypothetical protein